MDAQYFLRKNKISFQTSNEFGDWLVDTTEKEIIKAMNDFLPPGLKGLLLAAFLAAYMSTISTHLNWGTSYFINDLFKRFISKTKFLGP